MESATPTMKCYFEAKKRVLEHSPAPSKLAKKHPQQIDSPPKERGCCTQRGCDLVHHDSWSLDVEMEGLCKTQAMQRLKKLEQLGACSHVFPKAKHTRYQHSRGVCRMVQKSLVAAKLSVQNLRELCKSVPEACPAKSLPTPPDAMDELCVSIAALGHDLG